MARKKIWVGKKKKKSVTRKTQLTKTSILNKLKRKPKEPSKGIVYNYYDLFRSNGKILDYNRGFHDKPIEAIRKGKYEVSLQEIIEHFPDVDPSMITFDSEIKVYSREPEDWYQERYQEYLKRKQSWDKWYNENKEKIDKVEAEEKERIRKDKEEKLQKLKAEQEKIRREIEETYD